MKVESTGFKDSDLKIKFYEKDGKDKLVIDG